MYGTFSEETSSSYDQHSTTDSKMDILQRTPQLCILFSLDEITNIKSLAYSWLHLFVPFHILFVFK